MLRFARRREGVWLRLCPSPQMQRLMYYLCITTHILVCGSLLMFEWQESDGNVLGQPEGGHDMFRAWAVAFYWVGTCLSTVGFGDIVPTSNLTRLYAVGVMFFSIYMNVYLLSTGIAPYLKQGILREKMDQKKARLADLLRFYSVPWDLQKQVRLL